MKAVKLRDTFPPMVEPFSRTQRGGNVTVRTLLVFLAVMAMASCSAVQDYTVEPDGSGEAEIVVTVEPFFAEYILDLNAGLGAESGPLFDITAITQTFNDYPDLTLREVAVRSEYELYLQIHFDSIDSLFRDRDRVLADLLSFSISGRERTIRASLDRSGITRALAFARIDPTVTEILLPPAGDMMSVEYRDYLTWALEEYADESTLSAGFDDSVIETKVHVNGTMTDVRGGFPVGYGARFSVPLLELLTTAEAVEYEVRFTAPR